MSAVHCHFSGLQMMPAKSLCGVRQLAGLIGESSDGRLAPALLRPSARCDTRTLPRYGNGTLGSRSLRAGRTERACSAPATSATCGGRFEFAPGAAADLRSRPRCNAGRFLVRPRASQRQPRFRCANTEPFRPLHRLEGNDREMTR